MSVASGQDEDPTQQADAEPAPARLDNALAQDPRLAEPALRLTRSTTDALTLAANALAQAGQNAQLDIASVDQAVTDEATAVARSLAQANARLAAQAANLTNHATAPTWDLAGAWRRFQEQNAERTRQAMDSIRAAVDGIGPWLRKTAKAAGDKIADYYRKAAPPNWTTDPAAAIVDYVGAVRLALDEGIPLAWVPDQETVALLLAVRGTGADRRAHLHAILNERAEIILDYCEQRLHQILISPKTPADQQRSALYATHAVRALRLDLTAPAQAAATDLIDQLLHRAFTTIHGNYTHTSTPKRVKNLASYNRIGFTLLAMLREIATMMPVFLAMTPWRPEWGTPPPSTFSRHVTAHQITATGQVTGVNALIAVMLAVSLICQEHDSRWSNWRLQRYLDGQMDALLAESRRGGVS